MFRKFKKVFVADVAACRALKFFVVDKLGVDFYSAFLFLEQLFYINYSTLDCHRTTVIYDTYETAVEDAFPGSLHVKWLGWSS